MDAFKNFARSLIATAPSPASSGTSLVVTAGEGSLLPATPFNAVVAPANALPLSSNSEIVRVTSRTTDTLTITRTQEGSAARAIAIGDQLFVGVTAKVLTDIDSGGVSLSPSASARNVIQATADVVPLTVRMRAAQSANIQEWQDSAGAIVARITNQGGLVLPTDLVMGQSNAPSFAAIGSGSRPLEIQGQWGGATGALRLGNATGGIAFFAPVEIPGLNVPPSAASPTDGSASITSYDGGTGVVFRVLNSASGTPGRVFARGLDIASNLAAAVGLSVSGAGGQTVNIQEWIVSGGAVKCCINKNGTFLTSVNAAPADGDLLTGALAFWFDATAGSAKLKVKARQADGNIKTGTLLLDDGDVFYVTNFGADPLGANDSSTAITNAANAMFAAVASSNKGAELVFPPGVYKVTSTANLIPTVDVSAPITIRSDGATIDVQTVGTPGMRFSAAAGKNWRGWSLRDLNFTSNGGTPSEMVLIDDGPGGAALLYQFELDNLMIWCGSTAHGVRLYGTVVGLFEFQLRNVRVWQVPNTKYGIYFHGGSSGNSSCELYYCNVRGGLNNVNLDASRVQIIGGTYLLARNEAIRTKSQGGNILHPHVELAWQSDGALTDGHAAIYIEGWANVIGVESYIDGNNCKHVLSAYVYGGVLNVIGASPLPSGGRNYAYILNTGATGGLVNFLGVPASSVTSVASPKPDVHYLDAGTVVLAPAVSAQNVIQPTVATAVPLTAKGFTGQSAKLQEWQDSAGVVLASIDATGTVRGPLANNAAKLQARNGSTISFDWSGGLLRFFIDGTEVKTL